MLDRKETVLNILLFLLTMLLQTADAEDSVFLEIILYVSNIAIVNTIFIVK